VFIMMWMGFSFHETKCLSVGLAFFATIFQPQTIYIYKRLWNFLKHFVPPPLPF
jgi:hypothetical protein